MCTTFYIYAESTEGQPINSIPPIELGDYVDAAGERACFCVLGTDTPEEKLALAAIAGQLEPFLRKVHWGNIVIEVR